jgi:DNA replicative helicase MCM subunit Mcm2 (Cdc46/Mcm family)
MEIVLIAVVAVVIGAAIYVYNKGKTFDVNNDGKVDAADVKVAVKLIKQDVKAVADVNKDGKVDAADVKVATTKAKTGAKKAATKVKETAKKAAGRSRKPKAK